MTYFQGREVPQRLLEVLADENARNVLLRITHQGPARWSVVREELDLHPQAYQRALGKLQDQALIRARAPAETDPSERKGRRQVVELEATKLGHFLAEVWAQLNQDATRLARKHQVNLALLEEG